jgi:hypothetical protein
MPECACASCLPENRRQDNTDRMYAASVNVICVRCGTPGTTTVGRLIGLRQRYLCMKCDRRPKRSKP